MSDNTKFKILIVDDEKSNLDLLHHILKDEYKVYIAKSGEAALKRIKSDKPDLILLDVLMPVMNGFDVLKILKDDDETRGIPVIFITGLESSEDEEKGFFLGAVDYITKPFINSIVLARVKTHLKIMQQMRIIERLGLIDALTDIPNRRSFDNRIRVDFLNAVKSGSSLCVFMADVDNFKIYNDTFGHPKGDVLLRDIANILTDSLEDSNGFVARVGGEEFAFILTGTTQEESYLLADKIRKNILESKFPTVNAAGKSSYVTVSFGVAWTIPVEGDSFEELIKQADTALYNAKKSGRNRVCTGNN